MTNKTNRPLLDHQKQVMPMHGEITVEDALHKANAFATQERQKIEAVKEKRPKT